MAKYTDFQQRAFVICRIQIVGLKGELEVNVNEVDGSERGYKTIYASQAEMSYFFENKGKKIAIPVRHLAGFGRGCYATQQYG